MGRPGRKPEEFRAQGEGILLGQLVKALGLASSGGEAKHLVASGAVSVNGAVETRRGRHLVAGDVVSARGRTIRVVSGSDRPPSDRPSS
jgi:ribosome-associated protein